jgi:hypothetical protein
MEQRHNANVAVPIIFRLVFPHFFQLKLQVIVLVKQTLNLNLSLAIPLAMVSPAPSKGQVGKDRNKKAGYKQPGGKCKKKRYEPF